MFDGLCNLIKPFGVRTIFTADPIGLKCLAAVCWWPHPIIFSQKMMFSVSATSTCSTGSRLKVFRNAVLMNSVSADDLKYN